MRQCNVRPQRHAPDVRPWCGVPFLHPRSADLIGSGPLQLATEMCLNLLHPFVVAKLKDLPHGFEEPEQERCYRCDEQYRTRAAGKRADQNREAERDTPSFDSQGFAVEVLNGLLEVKVLGLKSGGELLLVH